uniref:Putative secreted protein n=1 Tax=Panstrongylus lignarius TaxID=156445 RepID=A0A224Y2T4_9HEMI
MLERKAKVCYQVVKGWGTNFLLLLLHIMAEVSEGEGVMVTWDCHIREGSSRKATLWQIRMRNECGHYRFMKVPSQRQVKFIVIS